MSMRIIKLTVHRDAADVCGAIEFLDQLRDSLSNQYGDEIRQMLQAAQTLQRDGDRHLQMTLPLNDQIPF